MISHSQAVHYHPLDHAAQGSTAVQEDLVSNLTRCCVVNFSYLAVEKSVIYAYFTSCQALVVVRKVPFQIPFDHISSISLNFGNLFAA